MTDHELLADWPWTGAENGTPDRLQDELCRRFARCFAGTDGEQVLAFLRRGFLDRRLPPAASDAELRHLEGQRCVVAQILALVERGRA
jgi:hypothetical protein